MKIIVKKHKSGEDAIPFLSDLFPKYNENDRWEIMAQICSYTILFTNNLRAGVEQFLALIGEPTISASDLVIVSFFQIITYNYKLSKIEC